jgi:hypothetical protein
MLSDASLRKGKCGFQSAPAPEKDAKMRTPMIACSLARWFDEQRKRCEVFARSGPKVLQGESKRDEI